MNNFLIKCLGIAFFFMFASASANTRMTQELDLGNKSKSSIEIDSETESQEVNLNNNPKVEMITSSGVILIELFPEQAPITVRNFLKYVESGFYNNTIFHRVIPNLLIQGGAYTPNLQLKKDNSFIASEANNGLSNKRGTIAAARRANDSESATSQFFFNVVDNPQFDFSTSNNMLGKGFTVFGKIIKGQEIVDAMRLTATESKGKLGNYVPKKPIIIQQARKLD